MFGAVKKVFAIFVLFFVVSNNVSHAVKILAVVNNAVITDVDVEDFSQALCKFDKRFKCGSVEAQQVAMFSYIETMLKQEHIKNVGIDLSQFDKGYEDYKKHVLSNMKFKGKVPETFNTYLYNEYIWEILISSQVRPESITSNDLQKYAERRKITITPNNEAKIKNELMQEKANELSKSMVAELKKYYLIDLKV